MTVIEHPKGAFEIVTYGLGCFQTCYDVAIVTGEWPSDEDLITMCDNKSACNTKHHFGGEVREKPLHTADGIIVGKRVIVYRD